MSKQQNRDPLPQMLRVDDAAAALGLSRVAVWAAIHRGDLPARRIGRAYLIPRSALEKLLTTEGVKRADDNGRA